MVCFLPKVSGSFISIKIESAFEPSSQPVDRNRFESILLQCFSNQVAVQPAECNQIFCGDLIAVMDNPMRSGEPAGKYRCQALIGRIPTGIAVFKLDAIFG
jgi:hypothetical protein